MRVFSSIFVVLISASSILAQDKVKTGTQPGDLLPDTFHPYNINGKFGIKRDAKGELLRPGRPHGLVTEFGLKPTVLIFARERAGGKNEPLQKLLEGVDESIKKDFDSLLRGVVVVLSPDAYGSVFEVDLPEENRTTDPKILVEQESKRNALINRLETLAEPLKNIVVAFYPARGPKGYNISDKAELTVILYSKLRVVKNYTFDTGRMTAQDVDRILTDVRALAKRGAKKED